jgi:hypothetical protein
VLAVGRVLRAAGDAAELDVVRQGSPLDSDEGWDGVDDV